MTSLFDPNTYLNALKKGKSALAKAKEYTAKPETRTGTLDRIKSSVGGYITNKAEQAKLPSTKAKFDFSRADKKDDKRVKLVNDLKKKIKAGEVGIQHADKIMKEYDIINGDEQLNQKGEKQPFLERAITGTSRFISKIRVNEGSGSDYHKSVKALEKENERVKLIPAFKKGVTTLDKRIAEIEKDFDNDSMSFSNNKKRYQLNKLKKAKEDMANVVSGKPQYTTDTIVKDVKGAVSRFTLIPEAVKYYDLFKLSKKDEKDYTVEDDILKSNYLIDQHQVRSTGSELSMGLVDSAEFGAEMMTSSAILKGLKKKVSKNVLGSIEAQLGKTIRNSIERSFQTKAERIIKEIPSTILQTALQQGTVLEVIKRNVVPELEFIDDKKGGAFELVQNDMGFVEATTRAFGSRFVENYTERLGDYMNIPKSEAIRNLKRTVMHRWIKNEGVANVMKKIEKGIRWDGIIPEILEEEIGEPAQAFIDERKYYDPITTEEGRDRLLQETLMIMTFDSLMKSPQYVGTLKEAVKEIAGDTRGGRNIPPKGQSSMFGEDSLTPSENESKIEPVKQPTYEDRQNETPVPLGDESAERGTIRESEKINQEQYDSLVEGIKQTKPSTKEGTKRTSETRKDEGVSKEGKGNEKLGQYYKSAIPYTKEQLAVWGAKNADGSIDTSKVGKEGLNVYKGKYYDDFEYQSGNIYEKLEELKKEDIDADTKKIQEKKLMDVMPVPKKMEPTKPKTMPTPEPKTEVKPKTMPTPEPKVEKEKPPTPTQILEKQSERAIQKDAIESQTSLFTKGDLALFDKMRKLKDTKKYASGDIETLRKDYPENVERMIERFNEATGQDLVDTEAFDEIMDMPSLAQLNSAQVLLTRKERAILRQDELTKLRSKVETAYKKATTEKEKLKHIQTTKESITEFSQKHLSLNERGKLLPMIKNVGINKVDGKITTKGYEATEKDFAKALDRMENLLEESTVRDLRKAIPKELKKYEAKKKEKGKTSLRYELVRNGYKQILKNSTAENQLLEKELSDKIETNTDLVPQDFVTYALLVENTKGLKDMDSKELKTILGRIKEEQLTGRESFLFQQADRAINLQIDIENSVENMQSRREITTPNDNKKGNFLTKTINVLDIFDRGYAQIVSLLDKVRGGRFFKDVLYRPIQKANERFFDIEADYIAKDKKMFEEIFLKGKVITKVNKAYKGLELDRKLKKFRQQKYIKDLKIWLSQGEMVDIYISSLMKENREVLMNNGMYIGGQNPKNRVLIFTEPMFETVKKNMGPEAKKVADYIEKQIGNKDFTSEMSKTYEDKYNKPFPFVQGGYWTMQRRYMGTKQEGVDMLSPDQKYKTTLSPSAFKERVKNDNPLLMSDAFTKFFNWRNDISRFVAYDKTFSDISSVINSKDFKSEFIEYFGASSYRQLVDSFEFVVNNGQDYGDVFAKGINSIKQMMSIMFIGGKTRNVLSQGSSALAGMAEVPVKDFTTGVMKAISNPKKAYEKLSESPIIRYRHKKAGFSKGMMEQETTAYTKQGVDISETAMYFTKVGDMVGVVGAGYGVYDAKLKEFKDQGYDEKTADRMALDEAVDFVVNTQQSALPEFANWIKRSHPVIRTTGAFQQAQSMYRAKWYDSVRQWKNDPNKWSKKSFSKLVKEIVAYQFMLPGMYEISRGNWNPASLMTKTLLSPISGFMGFGKVLEYGIMTGIVMTILVTMGEDEDDYEHLKPFDPSSLSGEALKMYNKAINSTQDVLKGEGDSKDILNMIDGAGALLKIPTKNLREEYLKMKDIVGGEDMSIGEKVKRGLQTEWQSEQGKDPELKERIKEQTKERKETKAEVDTLYDELKDLPKAEANKRANDLKKSDPTLHTQLVDLIEAKKLDLSDTEKRIKQLGVANGARSEYIYEQTEEMKTSKEKYDYIEKLKSKKLISDDVMEQITELKKTSKARSLYDELKDLPKDEANKRSRELSKSDPTLYKQLKKVIQDSKDKEEKKNPTKKEYLEQRGTFGLISDYTKAFIKDPGNAWKALATKEKLGIVEGNLVELQRFYGIKFTDKGGSQERKKELMEKEGIPWSKKGDYKLEHILPVTAGGDTSDENLMPVTNELHDLYTPIDIALGIAVKNEEITRKKADKLARAFKVDKTMTAEEVMKELD